MTGACKIKSLDVSVMSLNEDMDLEVASVANAETVLVDVEIKEYSVKRIIEAQLISRNTILLDYLSQEKVSLVLVGDIASAINRVLVNQILQPLVDITISQLILLGVQKYHIEAYQ